MTLALDFGTCNTVLARWNAATRQVETLRLGSLTRLYRYHPPGGSAARESAVVPSLVHYGEGQTLRVGAQVENAGLVDHRGTFRWVKLDILKGNNQGRRINGETIDPRKAADDFIGEVLLAASGMGNEDLVVTVPVEAYDPYVDWLHAAVLKTFTGRVRMLDEATACMLGYEAHAREGQVYVVFDFGGGTLDVSVVKIQAQQDGEMRPPQVLGRSGEEIGGSLVDQWLLEELQQAEGLSSQDVADVGTALLRSIEEAKIRLSGGEEGVEIEQFNDYSARLISHRFTRASLRRLLEQERRDLGGHSLYRLISRTVDRALELAQDKYGIKKSDIKAVFMAGGSSLLLGVAEALKNLFPDSPVHCEDPFEAIARGACRYAGEDINLSLVHDYCLHSWNRDSKDYELIPVAPKGTHYPTEKPVALKYINAACEGATRLGMVVVERSTMVRPEPVYQMEGGALKVVGSRRKEETALRELNPKDREFINAVPPCSVGEKRFVAGFGVDANRRLTVSLKDLAPGNRSFVQLSSGEKLDLPVKDLPLVKL